MDTTFANATIDDWSISGQRIQAKLKDGRTITVQVQGFDKVDSEPFMETLTKYLMTPKAVNHKQDLNVKDIRSVLDDIRIRSTNTDVGLTRLAEKGLAIIDEHSKNAYRAAEYHLGEAIQSLLTLRPCPYNTIKTLASFAGEFKEKT